MSQIIRPRVGVIIEGPGDRAAVPLLLRRYCHERGIYQDILGKPIPLKGKGSATKVSGIEGYAAAATSRPGCKALLVVLDADEDLPCQLGPQLVARISEIIQKPCVVSIAERDFEDWLYCSAETLSLGISNFEKENRGVKEIQAALGDQKYRKPVWQPKLAAKLDFTLARSRSVSFDRLLQRFDDLCKVTGIITD